MVAPPLPERVAAEAWAEARASLAARPRPYHPVLVVFAGVPLSGKSALARAFVGAARTATLHVENDALRERVARELGIAEPAYTGEEHLLTYRAAWRLLARGLGAGVNAVHDATNLNERARRPAYEVADAWGAAVVVALVTAPHEVLAARAAALPPTRQRAFAKLGGKRPDLAAVRRPLVRLDGAAPVGESLARLRALPELAGL